MAQKLLNILQSPQGQWHSAEKLRQLLDVETDQIVAWTEKLQADGYVIEQSSVDGYRMVGGGLNAELLEGDLQTLRIGRRVLVYSATNSTNDIAWNYSCENGYDGLAVFTERQRKGRGRRGHVWQSKTADSVLCSFLLCDETRELAQPLTLLAGLSVAEAVESVAGVAARIKWPNDVLINGKKVAGVMVESRTIAGECCYVIGAGVNCFQEESDFDPSFRQEACSIKQTSGLEVNRVALARQLMRRLDYWLSQVAGGDSQALHSRWNKYCDNVGRRITLECNNQTFTGRVVDVNVNEGLMLQLDGGEIKVFDGAVTGVVKDRN